VFADRYKAILIESEQYLLDLIRYVHLNPVRAGLVQSPDASNWSSHRIYQGLDPAPEWFDTSFIMEQFGPDLESARSAYTQFIQDGIGQPRSPLLSGDAWLDAYKEIRARGEFAVSDPILGSESFISDLMEQREEHAGSIRMCGRESTRQHRPPMSALVDVICEALELDRTEFEERPKRRGPRLARQLLVRVWVREYKGTQTEVARYMEVPAGMVSRWYSRAFEEFDQLSDAYERVLDALPQAETTERLETGETLPVEADYGRLSVNVEFVEEKSKILTPPKK